MLNAQAHLASGGNNAIRAGKEIMIRTTATGHTAGRDPLSIFFIILPGTWNSTHSFHRKSFVIAVEVIDCNLRENTRRINNQDTQSNTQ